MKKITMVLLAMLLLTGCGKQTPKPAPTPETAQTQETSQPDTTEMVLTGRSFWVSTRFAIDGEKQPLGAEDCLFELFLFDDGTFHFRETASDSAGNTYYSHPFPGSCRWTQEGSRLILDSQMEGYSFSAAPEITEDAILFHNYCDREGWEIRMEKQQIVPYLTSWQADGDRLLGEWTMVSGEIEGWQYDAAEENVFSTLYFSKQGDKITADYFSSRDELDILGMEAVFCEVPIYDGCSNEFWSCELGAFPDRSLTAAWLPDDTLLLCIAYDNGPDLYPTLSYGTYVRSGK